MRRGNLGSDANFARDAGEHGVEVRADQSDGDDDGDGNQGDHQAVLHSGGAFFLAAHAVDEGLDLGIELHGFSILCGADLGSRSMNEKIWGTDDVCITQYGGGQHGVVVPIFGVT